MEIDFPRSIECPECGAVAGNRRADGHLRWMFCGMCEASWRFDQASRAPAPAVVVELVEETVIG